MNRRTSVGAARSEKCQHCGPRANPPESGQTRAALLPFHISPTKPDYISSYALEVLGRFKGLNRKMGFAENLGVLIKVMQSTVDADHRRRLLENTDNRCFGQAIPRTNKLWHASQFSPVERSYGTKYPG